MIEWFKRNKIGIQVSLDDLENSKPLNNGESSSFTVLENIKRLQEANIGFSINTVFDYHKTKNLSVLVDYISSIKNLSQWGFSASYTINDDKHINEILDSIKLGIWRLRDNGFNVRNKFRFYNEVVNMPGRTCQAGVNIFAIGTNLEVWPCQSLIDKKPLGYFDENIKELLSSSKDNEYFFNRTLLPQYTDCSVLNWCRGGCRAVHLTDKKATDLTCRIKQEIIPFIIKETMSYHIHGQNDGECHHINDEIENIIKEYVNNFSESDIKPMFVETPPFLP
jgi:radical SAM protein with 4Fe4S-binding SPASM domain